MGMGRSGKDQMGMGMTPNPMGKLFRTLFLEYLVVSEVKLHAYHEFFKQLMSSFLWNCPICLSFARLSAVCIYMYICFIVLRRVPGECEGMGIDYMWEGMGS